MNGLAQILHRQGYSITGSDRDSSPFTRRLQSMGIPVALGHDAKNVQGAELVIYTAAIGPDNAERVAARENNIPEMERSVALGAISGNYNRVVCIAGCHGKTTITSMLARIAMFGQSDATVHVGGDVDFLSGGTRLGQSDLFITEACEYVESFLTLRPTIAVISNIDDDHLDYFRDIDEITAAYVKFLKLLPKDGLFIGCADDPRVKALLDNPPDGVRTLSYGLAGGAYTIADIQFDGNGCPAFDVIRNGEKLGHIALTVPGMHNIANALCACVVALQLNESFATIQEGLKGYTLTHRRFELFGQRDGIRIYHDYAHHPNEIRAVLDAATRVTRRKLYCVFQCNSYTRAKTLFLKDPGCFADTDAVLVPDIYPGRETDDGSVHARDIAGAINAVLPGRAMYIPTFEEIRVYLDENTQKDDMILTLGSGDVYKQTQKLL
jgi:UDP-N-acetylmuramate--alanine ligase